MEHPTAFISYSYDDPDHCQWVASLATRLRRNGVDVTLDQWTLALGDQLPAFMERAVRDNDFVLVICTPRYKARSDSRTGGVGYEGDIMTAEVLNFGNRRKFIPVLRCGSWAESAPTWLLASKYADLSAKSPESSYEELLRTLHGLPPEIPALGVSWLIEADRAAQYLHNHHFSAHRGAILWYHNVTAIFGNDGFSGAPEDNAKALAASKRSQTEVSGIRAKLVELAIEELGFGTDSSRYTWVILARTDKASDLNDLVWKYYPEGASNNELQRHEAFDHLWTYWHKPFNDQTVVFPV